MEISALGPSGSPAAAPRSTSLGDSFDTFLSLLTTQLQNQDPLSPLDSSQFTNQLVQFTQVEQQIRSNASLGKLIELQRTNQVISAAGYIDKTIEASGDALVLAGGAGELGYSLAGTADKTEITILDAAGTAVRRIDGSTSAGPHALLWDGRGDDGSTLPDGAYRAVVTAVAGENQVPVTTATVGRVTGVDLQDGTVMLSLGAAQVPLNQVIAIRPPSPPA